MRSTHLLVGIWLAASAAVAAPARPDPPLTPRGWGDLRIGMAEVEAIRRFGLGPQPAGGDCHVLYLPGRTDMVVLARNGRIGSLVVAGESRLQTDRGLRLGSGEAAVRRAYGPALQVEDDPYDPPPARTLVWWLKPRRFGVSYGIDGSGVVNDIRVGDETIGWLDGCD